MKKVFLFGTKLHMYLCELPIILIFASSIYFNGFVDGEVQPGRLYPLIIASGVGIVFMFVYLLRAVIISAEGVRSFGPFSSRDKAIINKDKTLVLTVRPKHRIKIELFGAADAPDFDWIKADDDDAKGDVNLYRDIAVGGNGAVSRVLSAFDVPKEDIMKMLSEDSFYGEYSIVAVTKTVTEHGPTYSVRFLKTV